MVFRKATGSRNEQNRRKNEQGSVFMFVNLDMSKIVQPKYWYYDTKLKYGDKGKLCYMVKDSLIVHVKSEDVYTDLAGDFQKKSDTSNFDVERPLLIEKKTKKVIRLMKDELGGRIMKEFVDL